MTTLSFAIPGECVPKGRPRHGRGRTYTPKRTADYERTVKVYASAAAHDAGVSWRRDESAALDVVIVIVLPRPGRLMARSAPLGRVPSTTRPDVDNYVKAVLDGIQAAGVISDDSQVYHMTATKVHGAIIGNAARATDRPTEAPHVLVTISDAGAMLGAVNEQGADNA